MTETQLTTLQTSADVLQFDHTTGRLVSFRSRAAPDQEFIVGQAQDPVFVIQYLDEERRFRQIHSGQAQDTDLGIQDSGVERTLTATFHRVAGLDLDVTVAVRADQNDRFSHWSLTLRNDADLLIADVQFPFVVVPYTLPGTQGTEALLWPLGSGVLIRHPQPQDLRPDAPHTWQMRPENGGSSQYPGVTVAQFLAFFNDRAGIYIACHDSEGRVKQIRPVHREPGCRLGISHVGDWPPHGERTLEYDVVLGSFSGDWYAAAQLYREWSLQQPWAQVPLHRRHDVPDWLLDSPPHIVVRIQGELDAGPANPNDAFLPYTKILPLLDDVAKQVDAPVLPVIMSWERPGPWVYPDCFPPAGGAESLRQFTQGARDRGWHVGTFCNGTRWVVGHYWSGYDGQDHFREQQGERSVCRTHAGELWKEHWDATWRPSYTSCVGTAMTRDIAADFVQQLMDYGLDWIQYFDQNVGVCTFPCFATDHEHPPVPGRWMTEKMEELIDRFYDLARQAAEDGGGEVKRDSEDGVRQFVFSVETPANEYYLPKFQLCDVRVLPPGHRIGRHLQGFVPLYHFLYHEFIVMQGGFGTGPEPYHLPIKNAYNWTIGEIPGAVLTGSGRLMNKDSEGVNWAPWEPPVGSNEKALQVLQATTALRRGAARPFLVFGRMLAPAQVEGIPTMRWQEGGRDHRIPAVFHSTWQAPDGQLGWALANWTNQVQEMTICDDRLPERVAVHTASPGIEQSAQSVQEGYLALRLPPLGCALVTS